MSNKLSLEGLSLFREQVKKGMLDRNDHGPQIIVQMGTSGLEAGARDVVKAILEELGKRELSVAVLQTDAGKCDNEPRLQVILPDQDPVTYGKVKPADVAKIIDQHVIGGQVASELLVC